MVEAPGTRLELYVRTLVPDDGHGPQQVVIDRLDALDADSTVTVWGEHVALSTTATRTGEGRAICDRLAAFRNWARRTGVSLHRFFTERSTRSERTGEVYSVVDLPVFALAEYRDGELVHVTPHEEDGVAVTVGQRLSALEAAESQASTDGSSMVQS